MTRLIVAFSNFVNAPKNENVILHRRLNKQETNPFSATTQRKVGANVKNSGHFM
jgi:hypothetical protein